MDFLYTDLTGTEPADPGVHKREYVLHKMKIPDIIVIIFEKPGKRKGSRL